MSLSHIPSLHDENLETQKQRGFSLKDLPSNANRAFGRELSNIYDHNDPIKALKPSIPYQLKSGIEYISKTSDKMMIESAAPQEQPIERVDKENEKNPQYVVPYVNEIYEYLRTEEGKYQSNPNYMTEAQKDINEKMRAILIDWLVDVHAKFKLLPETMFMTVNLIDRYLSLNSIPRQKLQLVGVASMLIASKYEEIYPPEVKDFVYVCDKAYNIAEILDMEGKILSSLSFKLSHTSALRFLERYTLVAQLDERGCNLAKYLIELSLVEFRMQKHSHSNLACSAIYLVNKLNKRESWSEAMVRTSKYQESQVRNCAKELCFLLQNAPKASLQAVRRKFSSSKFLEVAKIQLDTA